MITKIQKIETETMAAGTFAEAGAFLAEGQTVAIPTETVYGLAAWIGSEEGIRRIYEAKGRPSDNPLIVHVYPGCTLEGIVSAVPDMARRLMEAFWPGPLTLVMPKAPEISPRITGGLNTVAVRMPSHPVAQAMLSELKMPLVAPSANTSGRPSPTTAAHVYDDLQGKIPLILDAGPCEVGVESTVVDVTGTVPVVLRPGAVTREMIAAVLGAAELDPAVAAGGIKDPAAVPRSPGMKYRHYAPQGKLAVLDGSAAFWQEAVEARPEAQKKWGLLITEELAAVLSIPAEVAVLSLGHRSRPEEQSARLFAALRQMDEMGLDYAYAECLSREGVGEAVMNRLLKAAGGDLRKENE